MNPISWRRAVRPPSAIRTPGRRASRSQGQAIVELALILPIFLILVASALDLGRLFYSQISVNDAAREAALEASQNPTSFIANTACTSANKEQNRIMCRATNESRGSFVTIAPADVAMACSTNPCPAAPALGQTVSVTVTGHFRLITPLFAFMFGGQNTSFASTASAQLLATPAQVAVPGPVAAFDVTPDHGLTPLLVTVTDHSSGTGLDYGWAWGDGTFVPTPSGPGPYTHTYPAAGIWTITLTVSNLGGTSVATHTVTVSDPAPALPVASYNAVPPSGPVPLSVAFYDTSTGTPTSWDWDFDDGTVSNLQNPTHTFVAVRPYNVTLTVHNAGGDSTITKVVQVNPLCPFPISNFTVSPLTGRKNITQFDTTNLSTNMSTPGCNNIWSWNFGDGTGVSSSQSPANHIYTKRGTYTIELTASNLAGGITSSKSVTVTN
jgi:PKD repeat protein